MNPVRVLKNRPPEEPPSQFWICLVVVDRGVGIEQPMKLADCFSPPHKDPIPYISFAEIVEATSEEEAVKTLMQRGTRPTHEFYVAPVGDFVKLRGSSEPRPPVVTVERI
jgi:hypothetical protein